MARRTRRARSGIPGNMGQWSWAQAKQNHRKSEQQRFGLWSRLQQVGHEGCPQRIDITGTLVGYSRLKVSLRLLPSLNQLGSGKLFLQPSSLRVFQHKMIPVQQACKLPVRHLRRVSRRPNAQQLPESDEVNKNSGIWQQMYFNYVSSFATAIIPTCRCLNTQGIWGSDNTILRKPLVLTMPQMSGSASIRFNTCSRATQASPTPAHTLRSHNMQMRSGECR